MLVLTSAPHRIPFPKEEAEEGGTGFQPVVSQYRKDT